MKQKDLEYKLNVLVSNLQSGIYNLIGKGSNPEDNIFGRAQGLAEAIGYINLKFGKNYETNLDNIITCYKTPVLYPVKRRVLFQNKSRKI